MRGATKIAWTEAKMKAVLKAHADGTLPDIEGAVKTVFVVFKQGVYRHECGGIFTSQALAQAAAERFAESDDDDYHSWEVVPFCLDVPTPEKPLSEAGAVFSVRKGGAQQPETEAERAGREEKELAAIVAVLPVMEK